MTETRPKTSITLSIQQRLFLINALNRLPLSQFLELEYALNVPDGIMPALSESQGLRSKKLLQWIEGATGIGLEALIEVLESSFGISIAKEEHNKNDSPPKTESKKLAFAIAGSIKEVDEPTLKAIVALLRQKSDDASIEVVRVEMGSIKYILSGTEEGLERLKSLVDSGELPEILDHEVEYADFLETDDSEVQNGLDLSGADLRDANLFRADLRGASLFRANLIEADLRGASLFRANLIEADLFRADLREADLREADLSEADLSRADLREVNLSEAVMTDSKGLSEEQKSDFIQRGAIFKDSPEDRSELYSRPKVPV